MIISQSTMCLRLIHSLDTLFDLSEYFRPGFNGLPLAMTKNENAAYAI